MCFASASKFPLSIAAIRLLILQARWVIIIIVGSLYSGYCKWGDLNIKASFRCMVQGANPRESYLSGTKRKKLTLHWHNNPVFLIIGSCVLISEVPLEPPPPPFWSQKYHYLLQVTYLIQLLGHSIGSVVAVRVETGLPMTRHVQHHQVPALWQVL